jgi:hypothetical protein
MIMSIIKNERDLGRYLRTQWTKGLGLI